MREFSHPGSVSRLERQTFSTWSRKWEYSNWNFGSVGFRAFPDQTVRWPRKDLRPITTVVTSLYRGIHMFRKIAGALRISRLEPGYSGNAPRPSRVMYTFAVIFRMFGSSHSAVVPQLPVNFSRH